MRSFLRMELLRNNQKRYQISKKLVGYRSDNASDLMRRKCS
jgi:hypothetical protein